MPNRKQHPPRGTAITLSRFRDSAGSRWNEASKKSGGKEETRVADTMKTARNHPALSRLGHRGSGTKRNGPPGFPLISRPIRSGDEHVPPEKREGKSPEKSEGELGHGRRIRKVEGIGKGAWNGGSNSVYIRRDKLDQWPRSGTVAGRIRVREARHREASSIVRRAERGINNNSHIWSNKRARIYGEGVDRVYVRIKYT